MEAREYAFVVCLFESNWDAGFGFQKPIPENRGTIIPLLLCDGKGGMGRSWFSQGSTVLSSIHRQYEQHRKNPSDRNIKEFLFCNIY